MVRISRICLALGLVGCGGSTEVSWLMGGQFEWVGFNHRVSHLSLQATGRAVSVAVIGGTSTTGELTELDQGCDPDICKELPVKDSSQVEVHWAHASTKAAVGMASVELLATADGAQGTATIDLSAKVSGDVLVLIQGFSLDTAHPLSGADACYQPANGWHPRHIAIELAEPSFTGSTVSVAVTATFEAGNSLETIRQCVDEVNEQAQVPFTVQLLAVASDAEQASHPVSYAASYALGDGGASDPEPQPDPDAAARSIDLAYPDGLVGWSRLDWRFHDELPDSRGAYLRSLVWQVDPGSGLATGHATNYSKFTQLTGFDYAFEGTVVEVDLGDEVVRGTASAQIEASLDAEGRAELFRFSME